MFEKIMNMRDLGLFMRTKERCLTDITSAKHILRKNPKKIALVPFHLAMRLQERCIALFIFVITLATIGQA